MSNYTKYKIADLFKRNTSGAWGTDTPPGIKSCIYRATNILQSGKLSSHNIAERYIQNSQYEKIKISLNTLLLEKSGGSPEQPVGRIAYVDYILNKPSTASNFIQILDVDKSFSKMYVFYMLHYAYVSGFTNKFQQQTTGILNFKLNDYLEEYIEIAPLAEQQYIADILTTIDNLIDHTESLIAKYQSIKQGMMHDLFTRGVDANGRLRPPREEAPELYKESALGWIPREWEVTSLSAAISSIDAGKSFESPDIPAAPGEWGVLKVSAVHPDGFRSIENKVITKEIYINTKYQVLNGDLLITRANTPDLVGLSCIVENPRERLLLCDKTLRLKVNNSFNKKYIFYALQTDTMRRQIQISGTGSSGSMKNITQSDIYSFILSAPGLKEQQHIQGTLHHIDALILSEKTHLHKINCLKLGLMHDLLTGTVRIPPHLTPAQEPPHAV